MLNESYKLQITETVRKNKQEIPAEMKVASKIWPSTKFCHTKDLTLLLYAPKKKKLNKIVI